MVECFPGFVWCTEKLMSPSLLCDYLKCRSLVSASQAVLSSPRKIRSISGGTRTRGYRDEVAGQGWKSQNEDHWVVEAGSYLLAEASYVLAREGVIYL